jgi:hypothetical protein
MQIRKIISAKPATLPTTIPAISPLFNLLGFPAGDPPFFPPKGLNGGMGLTGTGFGLGLGLG